ncbi:ribosome biogenesis GTPase Der [Parasphingorhabdus sp. JC815]|uniref:ribosome biogenesis GTPase Der n=1 Tax=Parasphingorhabdus sp. JC815 TaxID=3232140 RepID=UPI003457585A
MLPNIAIIGRPNVGKSTLFNRLVGKKLALVDDRPGVTRDRREGAANLLGLEFNIIDTAGYEDEDAKSLPGRMRRQTEMAVAESELALFIIDGRAGLTPLDEEIARWLRGAKKPVVLLVNKAEGKSAESGILESYALGFGDPIPISAEHGDGIADLFQVLRPYIESFEAAAKDEPLDESAPLKLAIVGRPNAGKSTLINKMLDEDRLITGPEAGITRDSISVEWVWHDDALSEEDKLDGVHPDRKVRLIDTAGMRKRAKVDDKLEKLSVADAKRAIDFAEVVVLLLDATKGLEAQDLRIADKVIQEGRCLVIAINKWDVAEGPSKLFNGIRSALDDGLAQVRDVPLIAVSAFTGKGIDQLMKAAFNTRRVWSQRVATGKLNRWFEDAIEDNPPPAPGGKRIKLRYITQAKTRPPSFVIFGTRVDDLPESYRRYLINGIRRQLGFGGVPVRLIIRSPKNPFHEKD